MAMYVYLAQPLLNRGGHQCHPRKKYFAIIDEQAGQNDSHVVNIRTYSIFSCEKVFFPLLVGMLTILVA